MDDVMKVMEEENFGNKKAFKELNWKAKYSLEDSLISAWNWECKVNSKN